MREELKRGLRGYEKKDVLIGVCVKVRTDIGGERERITLTTAQNHIFECDCVSGYQGVIL